MTVIFSFSKYEVKQSYAETIRMTYKLTHKESKMSYNNITSTKGSFKNNKSWLLMTTPSC